MVQPGSAAGIAARAGARADGCPGRAGPASAITVTWRARPGWRGAATSTPTSRVCPAPGTGPPATAGNGVLTPGPSTLTVRPAARPEPEPASPVTVTLMT